MQAQGDVARNTAPPWQLQMYQKSLKKRQKVELLMRLMGAAGNRSAAEGIPGSASGARRGDRSPSLKDYFASTRFAELMMTSSIGASW
jgi:hypothetical protein